MVAATNSWIRLDKTVRLAASGVDPVNDNGVAISSTPPTRRLHNEPDRRPAPHRAYRSTHGPAGHRPTRNECAAPLAPRRPTRSPADNRDDWTGSAAKPPAAQQVPPDSQDSRAAPTKDAPGSDPTTRARTGQAPTRE